MILLATAATFGVYYYLQPIATYAQAPLMDGNQYLNMYRYFARETDQYTVQFPFHSRILFPALAAGLPFSSPVAAFQVLNLAFSLLSVALLHSYWRRLQLPAALMAWGFFWLLFHWTGLIRLNAYDPITVDVPLYCIQTLFLLIVWQKRWLHLWWFAPLATLQKESFPALIVVLLAYGWYYNRATCSSAFPIRLLVGCLLISAVAKYTANFFFPPVQAGSSVITVLYFIKQSLLHPFRLVRWMAGVWVAFGGMGLLGICYGLRNGGVARFNASILQRPVMLPVTNAVHTDLLFLFSCTYLTLSLLAGGDFTRIAFLGFPFIATYIFVLLKPANPKLWAVAGLLSLPLMHLTGAIPDQGPNWAAFARWYPEFAPWPVVVGILGYGGVVAGILWTLRRFRMFQ